MRAYWWLGAPGRVVGGGRGDRAFRGREALLKPQLLEVSQGDSASGAGRGCSGCGESHSASISSNYESAVSLMHVV